MQTMLKEHHAEYDRHKTRGSPRPAKALLHGLVSCGAYGHTMVGQYTGGPRSSGPDLRQQSRPPVCPSMAADPGDTRGVEACCQALSPMALDVYAPALAKRQPQAERSATAHAQPRARLRYTAASGERHFPHVDPAQRQGAAAREHAWAVALPALQQAEAAEQQRAQARPPPAHALPPARQAACRALGQPLPELWPTAGLSPAQRKALRRCLIAQVGSQRARRAQMHTRLGWHGGETTTFEVPVAGGALIALPGAHEMAQQIRRLCATGTSDEERARQLPQHGYRSPRRPAVLPRTVKGSGLKLGRRQNRAQSHPRRIAGALTGPRSPRRWASPPGGITRSSAARW